MTAGLLRASADWFDVQGTKTKCSGDLVALLGFGRQGRSLGWDWPKIAIKQTPASGGRCCEAKGGDILLWACDWTG
jgi:hypothetical protein